MRANLNPILKLARVKEGVLASKDGFGNNGIFVIRGPEHRYLRLMASDQRGWQHVSVAVAGSEDTPSWNEMCWVKEMFWEPEETVIQYHPPESQYVNLHQGVLHLWRKDDYEFPMPPIWMV